jgi:multidrug efflux system membrane fusion protein
MTSRLCRALAPVLMAALAAACAREQKAPPREGVPVQAGLVARRQMPVEVTVIGHVDPIASAAVKAQVGGQITEVLFKEGQEVQKGQPLLTIDPRPYEAALAQAKANLERDKAIARNAQADVQRYADLVAKEYVTAQQFDQAKMAAASSDATVRADEAAVENARLQVEYCTVRSPFDGRTGSLLVQIGNVVKANDDRTLMTVNQIRPIYVSFAIPERYFGEVVRRFHTERLAVRAALQDGGPPAEGELTFVDNAVNVTTGTIQLKGTFVNKDGRLWPGQFTDVVLILGSEPDAIVAPSSAVLNGQNGSYVFVVKNDLTVEARPVTVNRIQGAFAVIAKGLSGGERVVTDGQLRLSPGALVEIKPSGGTAS